MARIKQKKTDRLGKSVTEENDDDDDDDDENDGDDGGYHWISQFWQTFVCQTCCDKTRNNWTVLICSLKR